MTPPVLTITVATDEGLTINSTSRVDRTPLSVAELLGRPVENWPVRVREVVSVELTNRVDVLGIVVATLDGHGLKSRAHHSVASCLADRLDPLRRKRVVELDANLRALATLSALLLTRATLCRPLHSATL
jgi:hypothetical protein